MPRSTKDLAKYDNGGSGGSVVGGSRGRAQQTFMSAEEVAAGKKSSWFEMEITGTIRNLSPNVCKLNHLTALYLKNNNLVRLPPQISQLVNLRTLDISNNKLKILPAEIGDLINLR